MNCILINNVVIMAKIMRNWLKRVNADCYDDNDERW
jgi:hypothetical protein